MSRPPGWTPKPDASCGTASWASSERDAQLFSHHTGATSLIYRFLFLYLFDAFTPRWSQNILTLHQGKHSTQTVHQWKRAINICNYNWLEPHFSWKVLFPVWQLISAARNTLAAIKLSWSVRAYWLTAAFFSSFFASVKRETVNISAGVFSLSEASRSKVKFTKYFFCSAGHQFKIWRVLFCLFF